MELGLAHTSCSKEKIHQIVVSSHNHLIRVFEIGPSPYINITRQHIGHKMSSIQMKRKEHNSLKN